MPSSRSSSPVQSVLGAYPQFSFMFFMVVSIYMFFMVVFHGLSFLRKNTVEKKRREQHEQRSLHITGAAS